MVTITPINRLQFIENNRKRQFRTIESKLNFCRILGILYYFGDFSPPDTHQNTSGINKGFTHIHPEKSYKH